MKCPKCGDEGLNRPGGGPGTAIEVGDPPRFKAYCDNCGSWFFDSEIAKIVYDASKREKQTRSKMR